ncbi:PLP-dependent transferase [Apiospora arundinis]
MSSNILSRRIPIKNFSLIFFGAQKNLGSTGITVVIVKKSLLPPSMPSAIPDPAEKTCLYNTLSIFDVYIAGLVLKKLLASFPDKIDGQEAVANKKAKLIYEALESQPDAYRIVPRASQPIPDEHLLPCYQAEKAFLEKSKQQNLEGLKGHRSVGGIRASNYNAIPLEGAEKLAKFISQFAKE